MNAFCEEVALVCILTYVYLHTFCQESLLKRPYRCTWVSVIQTHLLGQNLSARAPRIEWPEDASFAVSRAALRTQPRWLYVALLRLFIVEDQCGAGAIRWAHALERLWFEVLNVRLSDLQPPVGWFELLSAHQQSSRCLVVPRSVRGKALEQ